MSRSSPFFRSPLYGNAAYFSPLSPSPSPSPVKPKVVSIPVHFVGSDNGNNKKSNGPSPAAAAIRIQSAFRGFVARKNVKVVRAIEAEVDEIEMRLRRDEREMDLIVRDGKERLKINEMLMRLLFRLDSVRGVRDYRKRVIRRVITIQDMLDSFAAAAQTLGEVETLENTVDQVPDETLEMLQNSKPDEIETLESGDQVVETAESKEGWKPDSKPGVAIEESKTLDSIPETAGDHNSNGWDDLATKEDQESFMDAEESLEIPESESKEKVGNDATASDVMERMGGLLERVENLEKIVEKMEGRKKKRKDSSSPAPSVYNKCERDNNDKQSQ